MQLIERGRYVAMLGGCDECHSSGYSQAGGNLPEAKLLTGGAIGFQGPWGTTYAPNLRKEPQLMSAEDWVSYARVMKARPPMPYFILNRMSDADLRAIYAYLQYLGPADGPGNTSLPPGVDATTPIMKLIVPQN